MGEADEEEYAWLYPPTVHIGMTISCYFNGAVVGRVESSYREWSLLPSWVVVLVEPTAMVEAPVAFDDSEMAKNFCVQQHRLMRQRRVLAALDRGASRWQETNEVSPSGKILFRCRVCGNKTPAPYPETCKHGNMAATANGGCAKFWEEQLGDGRGMP